MKIFIAALLCIPSIVGAAGSAPSESARWQQYAEHVHIVRDNWGIAHVYGKSDADAVFGMIYAQAEDDFNRIEHNYLISLGWLAQAEGESAVYSDLRARLFIDVDELKRQYRAAAGLAQVADGRLVGRPELFPVETSERARQGHSALRTLDGLVLHRGQYRRRH